ncbi:MAG: HAD family hydrolase [Thermoplasmata archaeon]|nr:HAD family hydrolase [Thermoplasmata archaeon]
MAALTFDLWHTLIQLAPEAEDRYIGLQEATLAEILRTSPPAPGRGAERTMDPADAAHQAWSSALARKGQGAPISELARVAANHAGRRPEPERWVAAIDTLVEAQPFEEVPGARDQLRRLVDEGYRIAVVSNLVGESGRSMRRVLERLDMAPFIESWALSEELPWAKPAPEIFWKALEPIGTLPSDAVHFGDLGSDIHGARAAGFRCSVLFQGARNYGALYSALSHTEDRIDPPPERVLSSWKELPPLLEDLFSHDRPSARATK